MGAMVEPREFEAPGAPQFRILAIDGGGIRGLIPALVLARLEELIAERDPGATLASSFDLIAGTSTGGLIALGLTTPDREGRPAIRAADMAAIYSGGEARAIFSRPKLRRIPGLGSLTDLLAPRYGHAALRAVLEKHFGDTPLAAALTGLLITSYDMHGREPRLLKPWQPEATEISAVEAGLATASAPTYFPPLRKGDLALVDGGIFANNPAIAASIEALKRTEGAALQPEDLLVISLGTGHHERGYDGAEVEDWGAAGWVLPKGNSEPPLIGAMLDGQSDATDHWAHMLLNHRAGAVPAREPLLGAGPRYFRWQVRLPRPLPLDGVSTEEIGELRECGETLVAAREAELEAVADVVAGRP